MISAFSTRIVIFLYLSGHMTRSAVYRSVMIAVSLRRDLFIILSHLEVPWQMSCDAIHLHHAVLLSGLGNMSARWWRRGGGGVESSAGVACRPSVGLWCKRACERLPCDTPTVLRQELRHRQLTVALELNAATHAVIGLVFETRPSSRRTTSFFLAFSGEETVGFM